MPPTETNAIGRVVRECRNLADMTLDQVADRAGLSKTYLSNVENGTADPSPAWLHIAMTAIGTELERKRALIPAV